MLYSVSVSIFANGSAPPFNDCVLQTILQLDYLLIQISNLLLKIKRPLAEDVGASSDNRVFVVNIRSAVFIRVSVAVLRLLRKVYLRCSSVRLRS